MSHANARLTVRGRMLIVQRRQQGWKQAHIAAAMGFSRKCVLAGPRLERGEPPVPHRQVTRRLGSAAVVMSCSPLSGSNQSSSKPLNALMLLETAKDHSRSSSTG